MDSPALCTNNCGFFGSPAKDGFCSKCHLNDYIKKALKLDKQVENGPVQKPRCEVCNKKISVLGFICKCGGAFCGMHRYPEVHSCDFDYKTPGRLLIEKHNPLCAGDKLCNRI